MEHQQQHEDSSSSSMCVGAAGCKSSLCRQSSARWNPTNEQKRILWDLYYNCGVRSPSGELIQKISAKLRQYGKIEGKNVFYWFQNHKARERQKRRLTLDIPSSSATTTMPPGLNTTCSSPGLYGAGEMGSSGYGGSVMMERTYWDCFMVGGRDAELESNMGWVLGLEMPPMHPCNDDQTAGAAHGEIETLPLFPVHAQAREQAEQRDYQEEEQTERDTTGTHMAVKAEPLSGCFPSFSWGGGSGQQRQQQQENHHLLDNKNYGTPHHSSLELTLNSYCYPSPGSM